MPKIKTNNKEFFANNYYDLKHYSCIAQILLDMYKGVILDIVTKGNKISIDAIMDTKRDIKGLLACAQNLMAKIDKLNVEFEKEVREGEGAMAGISDSINDYITMFYPHADLSEDKLVEMVSKLTNSFNMLREHQGERERVVQEIIQNI